MKVERIDHISLKIPEGDLKECLSFYRDTLGFEPFKLEEYRKDERTSFFFKIGEKAMLNIRPVNDFEAPAKNLDHFCLICDQEVSELESKVEENGFEVYRKGTPLGSKGRDLAIYVKDPFGYRIELKENSE